MEAKIRVFWSIHAKQCIGQPSFYNHNYSDSTVRLFVDCIRTSNSFNWNRVATRSSMITLVVFETLLRVSNLFIPQLLCSQYCSWEVFRWDPHESTTFACSSIALSLVHQEHHYAFEVNKYNVSYLTKYHAPIHLLMVPTKHDVPFWKVGLQETEIRFPFIANHLATCKASNRNDHSCCKLKLKLCYLQGRPLISCFTFSKWTLSRCLSSRVSRVMVESRP
jgi:hypothetical protein